MHADYKIRESRLCLSRKWFRVPLLDLLASIGYSVIFKWQARVKM